jgi:two-component system sensor histidine kinase CiaH
MFRSATIRLTSWYVLMVSVICLLFSVAFYRVATIELNDSLERETHRLVQDQRIDPRYTHALMQESLEQGSNRILVNLLIFDAILLGAGTVASYFLAKRTLEPLQAAHEAQKRFASDASHELRTPLTAMKTEIEVMMRTKQPQISELREQLQSNLEEIGKLEALSTGLLQLAKYEENDSSIIFDRIDLSDVVTAAYERLAKAAQHRKISIDLELDLVFVIGDRSSLVELIAILLDNAIKYSADGSKIELSTKLMQKHAVVIVRDHGVGISAEDIPHIFDRFYQADTSRTKQKNHGYGLGLSLAKAIVERHHGSISINSIVHAGTSIIVSLPYSLRDIKDTQSED